MRGVGRIAFGGGGRGEGLEVSWLFLLTYDTPERESSKAAPMAAESNQVGGNWASASGKRGEEELRGR